MKSFWTPARDKRLLQEWADGRSAAEIAKTLGTTRNAVIGRSSRLRGIKYASSIASWKRSNAKKSEEAKRRGKLRLDYQRRLIREMAKAVAGGMAEGRAMSLAHRNGATWGQIAEHFGISEQVAYHREKMWREETGTKKTWSQRALPPHLRAPPRPRGGG
jgi:transposase